MVAKDKLYEPIVINGKKYIRSSKPNTGCRECIFDDNRPTCVDAEQLELKIGNGADCMVGHFIYAPYVEDTVSLDDADDLIMVSMTELKRSLCKDFCPYDTGSTQCNTDACMVHAVASMDRQYDYLGFNANDRGYGNDFL